AHAAQGGHWEVAREQFAILGNRWDRTMMTPEEHALWIVEANHPPATPSTTTGTSLGWLGAFGWIWRIVSWVISFL
ncbi:MAG TPA: hypothetical protein VGC39_02790, partial [Candidatus Methylacidiphilales bacterium]